MQNSHCSRFLPSDNPGFFHSRIRAWTGRTSCKLARAVRSVHTSSTQHPGVARGYQHYTPSGVLRDDIKELGGNLFGVKHCRSQEKEGAGTAANVVSFLQILVAAVSAPFRLQASAPVMSSLQLWKIK